MYAPSPPIRRALLLVMIAAFPMLISGVSAAQENAAARVVDLIQVEGVIDPPVADYLTSELQAAEEDGVHAAIVQLDTPGGLEVSMRSIVKDILDSEVPVVVWVAPRGARAASAGTFIAYSANLAFMAEATELGAATPVNLGGDVPEVIERKATEDAAAFIRSLATTRDRNERWGESAVRAAASIGATEALSINVIDGIASSLRELLENLDGRQVEVASGRRVTLETWDGDLGAPTVTVRFQDLTLVERVLHAVTSPKIAFFLLLAGAFGLIFEIYNPGIGLAGILGAGCLLLAFYALSVLPTNWLGVLLVAGAIALLVIDLHTSGLGVFTVAGISALVAGGLLLFAGADPALELSGWAIAAAVLITLLFFISVMTAAVRVRLRRPVTGEEGMIGAVAEAKTDIAPEGTVITKGTLWRARTMETGIAAGSKVRVMATEGLVLLVEPLHSSDEAAPNLS